jgi:hypothetical protein
MGDENCFAGLTGIVNKQGTPPGSKDSFASH